MIALVLLPLLFAPSPQDDGSLENLRARLSLELEAEVAAVRPRVETLLAEVVKARLAGSPRHVAEQRALLGQLPSSAALVLIEHLAIVDPLVESQVARATEAGNTLRTVSSAVVLPQLVELASHPDPTTRRLALAAMGGIPAPDAASEELARLLPERRGTERAVAVGSLVRLGGARGREAFAAAVAGRDGESVRAAIAAATERRDTSVTDLVDLALADSEVSKQAWSELISHLAALPELVEPGRVQSILGLAYSGALRGDVGAMLVERVGRLGIARRHVQDQLESIARSSDQRVAEAGYVALALLGDRNAEKRLIEEMDAAVDQARDGDSGPLRARGQMRIRLGDYAGAVNDLRKALKAAKDGGAFVQREINIDIARAYALNVRLDKAMAALEDAGLTNARRDELAVLPEFAALAEHSRYGEALERR